MAIKYRIETGAKHLNTKAYGIRDGALKPALKGIRCTNCGGDSEFVFVQDQSYPGSSSVNWRFHACCDEFKQKVHERLGMNR